MLTPPMLTGKIKILQHCYGQNRHPAILTDMCIYTAARPQLWGHKSWLVGFVCFKSLSSLWSGDDKLFREPLLSSLNERNERWPPVTVSKKKKNPIKLECHDNGCCLLQCVDIVWNKVSEVMSWFTDTLLARWLTFYIDLRINRK